MQTATPFFSVITVCRNTASIIQQAKASLLSQTCQNWEWIVVDGASEDDTVAKVKQDWPEHLRMTLISEPDSGIYDAMNKGVLAAKGTYLHFLNADDSYADEKVLEEVAQHLAQNGEIDFLYGNIQVTSSTSPTVLHCPPPPETALEEMVCGCLPHQGSFARRSLFHSPLGLFKTHYKTASDYAWMLSALLCPIVKVAYLARCIALYNADGASSKLATCLPEVFTAQNAEAPFQQKLGTQRVIRTYQKHVIELRIQNQLMQSEVKKLKDSVSKLKEKVATLNLKKAATEKPKKKRFWLFG